MSRCFPFPPPGYEKKARTEDVDFIKKEKHREKKHKKEKRDREKKEGREKREKDRSDGKHTEKKDKKEKHRDKKKDKEKDRVKEKNSAPDEKRLPGQAEGHSGEKLIQNEEMDKDKNGISNKTRFSGHNGEKLSESIHLAELGRRIKDDDRATENKLVENFTYMDRNEEMVKLVAKGTGTWAEGKDKTKRVDDRKMDLQRTAFVQTRVEGLPRPFEKNIEKRMEEKEKTKEKEGDDKQGDKRKDKVREKKSQGKDKNRDKEKKKEVKVEHKNTGHNKLKDGNKNDLIGSHYVKTPQLLEGSNKNAASEENLKKRKEVETNGVLHATDGRPNKLARPTSSNHFSENGRMLEPCQASVTYADRQGAASNLKEPKLNGIIDQSSSVSLKKPMLATAQADQITEASAKPPNPDSKYLSQVYTVPSSSVSLKKPILATAQADQIAEAAAKPPHLDSKYLSQVYTVPKMDELFYYDDQEWLFSSNGFQSEKPKVESSRVEETPQVWAEALRIESADVCALPYVIPY
ncbi:hypothetical protein CMV_015465 [Castanea mollissima]|uniref:Myb-like protein X n=1 Tax=Castanea mollissima TaxID=60419 RepID=A0A8J4QUG7_9ROSI|nr:hypothetical protein CMV_015465 [Castanea mollissima]